MSNQGRLLSNFHEWLLHQYYGLVQDLEQYPNPMLWGKTADLNDVVAPWTASVAHTKRYSKFFTDLQTFFLLLPRTYLRNQPNLEQKYVCFHVWLAPPPRGLRTEPSLYSYTSSGVTSRRLGWSSGPTFSSSVICWRISIIFIFTLWIFLIADSPIVGQSLKIRKTIFNCHYKHLNNINWWISKYGGYHFEIPFACDRDLVLMTFVLYYSKTKLVHILVWFQGIVLCYQYFFI